MHQRRVFGLASLLATVFLVTALGGAATAAQFAGKPALVAVDAYCVKGGGDVFVEVSARYPDAPKAKGAKRHMVQSQLRVLDAMGMPAATDGDSGRAQVDIPQLSSYVHTHQHRLSKAAGRRLLDGKPCSASTAVPIRARATLSQSLAGGGKAGASAAASQSTAAAAATAVTPVATAPTVENGCVFDSKGLMDCSGAFLQKASFVGENLPYANFSFANLLGADFAEARLGHAQMNKAVLDQADLSGAELGSASLTSASLIETDLSAVKAPYANFAVAKFDGANLRGANLTGANLAEASFGGANGCDVNTKLPGIFGFVCSNSEIVKR